MKMYLKAYIQLTCAVSILTSPAPSSLDVDSLLELMTLTEQTCGGIHWCTVQSPVTMETKMAACCPRCSCDRNCTTSAPCCPDITLRDYLAGQVFPNIIELAAVLNQTMTSDFEADMYESMNTYVDDKREEKQCIKSRLFLKSATIPNSPMYVMVSKCTNLSASPTARAKCESPAIVDADKTDITELLPLQSTSTGLVYRNKYCEQCSLPDTGPFVEWEVWIAADLTPLEFQSYHFSTMHDVVRFIFQQDQLHGTYDIFFEPSKELKERYPPKMCQVFDVHACKNGTTASQAARSACERYILPVYSYAAQKSTFVRNIACLSCNDYIFPYTCWSSSYRWGAPVNFLGRVPQLNIQKTMETTQIDLQTAFGPECNPGHIYDSKRNICRKIYCPCMMVVRDSTCVSIFEEVIYKKFFSVHIDLVIRSKVKDQRNDSEDQTVIFRYVTRVFESSDEFQTDHITLSVTKGDNPSPKRYIVFIAFTGKNEHIFFPDVIAFISMHFRGIKRMENNGFRIRMDITDSMDVNMHGIMNINTGHSYEVAMTTSDMFFEDNILDRSKLQVSECHFCHMIELLEDEMDNNGCAVFVKPSQTLERGCSTFVSNVSRILVCAAKVISNVDTRPNTIKHETEDHLTPITTDADAGPLVPAMYVVELTALGSTLGFLVVTVCIIATVQICLKHKRPSQQISQDNAAGQIDTA